MSAPTPDIPPRTPAFSRVVAVLTAALGGAVIVATVVGGIAPTVALASAPASSQTYTAPLDDVDAVDIDVAAVAFSVVFDDVDEATLDVRDARRGAWTLEQNDSTLFVASPEQSFRWFGSWFGGQRDGRVTLTLPRELEGADVEAQFGAGAFEADGRFGTFDLQVGAGQATLLGSATALTVEMGAGRADIDLDGVRTADLEVSAGAMIARLTGDAPDEIDLSVSAGSLELTIPDDDYDITSDVSAGDFTSDLRSVAGAAHRLNAEVSAGDLTVRAE